MNEISHPQQLQTLAPVRRRSLPRRAKLAAPAAVALAMALGGMAPASAATASPASAATSFSPASVSFISSQVGWALGAAKCSSGTCLAMFKTSDGGSTWVSQPLAHALVTAADKGTSSNFLAGTGLNVRFADAQDGWVYGYVRTNGSFGLTDTPALWSTHDGGTTWYSVALAGINSADSSILDLEAGDGHAYLVAQVGDSVKLESTAVAHDAWTVVTGLHLGLPAGGSNMSGAIVLQADVGWLVAGNDRGTTGSARLVGGKWQDWTPPCANVGGTLAYPAAASPSYLAAVCVMGGFASPLSKSAPKGATVESSWLYVSTNGGTTFKAVSELGKLGTEVGGVIASPAPGVIVLSRSTPTANELEASFDGGHHWSVVYNGSFNYLGFTTASQGVAIVGSASQTAMIMTHDGGHDWQKVSF
jgi:sorbitol-specific phosphotransferase system component IIA